VPLAHGSKAAEHSRHTDRDRRQAGRRTDRQAQCMYLWFRHDVQKGCDERKQTGGDRLLFVLSLWVWRAHIFWFLALQIKMAVTWTLEIFISSPRYSSVKSIRGKIVSLFWWQPLVSHAFSHAWSTPWSRWPWDPSRSRSCYLLLLACLVISVASRQNSHEHLD